MSSSDDDKKDAEVVGFLYTQWDCPDCGAVNVRTVDIRGVQDKCDTCGFLVHIVKCV